MHAASEGARAALAARALGAAVVLGATVAACGPAGATTGAVAPALPPPVRAPAAVGLGATQRVTVASSFGPGRDDVAATVTVLAVRDHVAPDPAVRPSASGSHWASAEVRLCRSSPVVLGYPAWVLGDDQGRTAQVTKVWHSQFPQPRLQDDTSATGCRQGWVTWVTADDLRPTQIRFEQTHDVPGAWRLHLSR